MTFLKTMVFSVAVLLVFTGFANILPQVQSDPPAEEEINTGSLDMAGMIAYGERLFSGKGTCTLCHNDLGRAPDLLVMDLAADFPARLADPRNEGASAGGEGPEAVAEYLRESMVDPSAFVVAGFGKKGTDDAVSPMPVANAPPIELNNVEMNALIAFLQDRAGMEPAVPLPGADDVAVEEDPDGSGGDEESLAADGLAAIDKFFCASCHDLEGSEADIGPVLDDIGTRMGAGQIMVEILDPNASVAEGYEEGYMPEDFGEQMHASELTLIVEYLQGLSE